MQLMVLGMHRSGTSVLARLLNMLGLHFGPEGVGTGANAENPKGFWERRDVRALNDFVLHSAGCEWDRIASFDPLALDEEVRHEFLTRATRIVLELDAHRPWFLKEPRFCLLLPLWREVLELPVVVHVLREPLEVARSLEARNGMSTDVSLALWRRYVLAAERASAGLPRLRIRHDELLSQPVAAVARLRAALAAFGVEPLREPSPGEIHAFIDPALYRARDTGEAGPPGAQRQQALFQALAADAPELPEDVAADRAADAILRKWEDGQDPVLSPRAMRLEQERLEREEQERVRALGGLVVQVRDGARTIMRALRDEILPAAQDQPGRDSTEADAALSAQWRKLRLAVDAWQRANEKELALTRRLAVQKLHLKETLQAREAELLGLRAEGAIQARRAAQAREARQQLEARLAQCQQEIATLVGMAEELARQRDGLRQTLALLRARGAAPADAAGWRGIALGLVRRVPLLYPWLRRRREMHLLATSGFFDRDWYLRRYPDVRASGGDPILHYLRFGAREGRDPGPLFSTRGYIEKNPDVAAAGINPLVHYVLSGASEGRQPASGGGGRAD